MSNNISFYVVTLNGLLDAINPCAIGVLLATIGVLFALGGSRKKILTFGFLYVLATYVTYLLIGLGILKAVHFFGIHNFFAWASAVFMIGMGVYQMNNSMCVIPKKMPKEATVLTGLILGVLVGLCEFPCSGGIYLATVGLIGLKNSFWQGLLLLLWYNFMFVFPLIVIYLIAYNEKVAKILAMMTGSYGEKARKISSWIMILLGLAIIVWLVI